MTEPPVGPGPDETSAPVSPPPTQGGQAAPGGPSGPNLDFSILLKGNWVGAGMTAVVAFGVALVLGLIVAFGGAEDLDALSAIWMTLLLTANAFGADSIVDLSGAAGADEYDLSVGHFPLLATFLALGAAAYFFRRATSGYTQLKDVLMDAARAGVLLSALVVLLAIVTRIATPDIEGYESVDSAGGLDVFGLLMLDGESNASVAGAIFLPFLLLLVVLTAISVATPRWWTGRWQAVSAWLDAPLAGLAAVVVGLFGAGLLWTIAQVAGNDDARGFSEVVRVLAVLPAAGMQFLGLGTLSKIGASSDGDDGDSDNYDRLWDFADDNGVLFWLAPLAALAIAAMGVWAVIKRTSDRSLLLRNVAVYLGSLVIFIPLLVRLSNAHVSFSAEFDGRSFDQDTAIGVNVFQTMFLFLLLSAVVAAVLLVITGNLDVNQLKSQASAIAKSVQTNAGKQEQKQQWGQQPPSAAPPATGETPPPPPPPTAEGEPPTTPPGSPPPPSTP